MVNQNSKSMKEIEVTECVKCIFHKYEMLDYALHCGPFWWNWIKSVSTCSNLIEKHIRCNRTDAATLTHHYCFCSIECEISLNLQCINITFGLRFYAIQWFYPPHTKSFLQLVIFLEWLSQTAECISWANAGTSFTVWNVTNKLKMGMGFGAIWIEFGIATIARLCRHSIWFMHTSINPKKKLNEI